MQGNTGHGQKALWQEGVSSKPVQFTTQREQASVNVEYIRCTHTHCISIIHITQTQLETTDNTGL